LRWSALAFGVIGVAVLIVTARWREVPYIRPGGVKRTMQFAKVRMSGIVERNAFIGEKNGQVDYMAFTLVDGTQSVRVAAYDEAAVALVSARQVPKAGERVTAEGSIVTGRDGRMRLRIDDAKAVTIEHGR
jgi:cytochrome c-type biogenesis protein CcmE